MADTPLLSTQVDRAALTPMMRHYIEMKDRYPHAILLYRLGDFYEAFFEDALLISRELELVLTGRDGGKAIGRVPMSGIPYHALERYARQLVEKGYAIAVCDQMESAEEAQGLVRREVTRTITPGTAIEEGMLAAKQNNFLAALVQAGDNWGLAYADVSTGEFCTTQLAGSDRLVQELLRLQPAEILFPSEAPNPTRSGFVWVDGTIDREAAKQTLPPELPRQFCYTFRGQTPFLLVEAKQTLLDFYRVRSLEGFGCADMPLAIRAAGGLVDYLNDTQKETRPPLHNLTTYAVTDYLILDHQTRRNLEIVQTVRDGSLAGSLLSALDRCATTMGSRLLRRWLLQPLKDRQAIADRADTVAELRSNHALRSALRQHLSHIYDIERLCGRIGAGTANARDLVALGESLHRLDDIAGTVAEARSPFLIPLQQVPPAASELADRLLDTLTDTPPLLLTEGGLIRDGVHPQLDTLRQQAADDVQWMATLEKTERERTGINTLKVGFSKAFGYYISISRGKSDRAPADYIRKQTLVNEERYITAELKEREARILNARAELNALEYAIFTELRAAAAEHIETLRRAAMALAAADVLASWAEVANQYNYCRPTLTDDRGIDIVNGRHPVVEQALPAGFFVPNSACLGSDRGAPDLIVLTGPNMSGKSIYLRQVGLIQLLAQTGCFVPAQSATLGICDRIFTRVGAVDDLATGQSTFMVEMNETANILNHATPRSLVLLDEIGRGTSTFDGMAIAWSVAEYLAVTLRARTMFATHYHELNELAGTIPHVANFQVAVKELADEIVFLHQVQPGGADRSYGIEVARLAGLPPTTIARAKELLHQIGSHSHIATGLRRASSKDANGAPDILDCPEKKPLGQRRPPREARDRDGQLSIFASGDRP